jgi:predicted N-acetyltransferase YhbS
MAAVRTKEMITIRPLERADLGGVVAIDAALTGRPRRAYIERRLAAALREPALHVQLAAVDGTGLIGCALARRLAGEFGRRRPALRLELIGVRADMRRQAVGSRMLEGLVAWARRHGVAELSTSVSWRDLNMLGWLAARGFELAGDRVLVRPANLAELPAHEDAAGARNTAHEVNFDGTARDDFERLARDTADVRSMTMADMMEIARIDRAITGRDRSDYIAARLAETMSDSAIRVSLTARRDAAIVGYLMARADLGDFGRTEPVAVIDTLGVEPEYAGRGVGRALLSQLLINLAALQVERVETIVEHDDLALLGFFQANGFVASQRLVFVRRLEGNR